MPRVNTNQQAPRSKRKDKGKGLWFILRNEDGTDAWVPVKKHAVTAKKIIGAIKKAYAKPTTFDPLLDAEEKQVVDQYGQPQWIPKPVDELDNVWYPRFQEDINSQVVQVVSEKVKAELIKSQTAIVMTDAIKGSGILPATEDEKKLQEQAEQVYQGLITEVVIHSVETAIEKLENTALPSPARRNGKVDWEGNEVEQWEIYRVVDVDESGRQLCVPIPRLDATHHIYEYDPVTGNHNVLPRKYFDIWLKQKLWDVVGDSEAESYRLHAFHQKLGNYPFPVVENGQPVMDGDGEPMIVYNEGMLVCQGLVLKKDGIQYHAFIISHEVKDGDETKFIFEMIASETPREFPKELLMSIPKEGERPRTISPRQQPLTITGVAQMIKQFQEG